MLKRNDIIFLATDHAGFAMKEDLKRYLLSSISPILNVEIIDYGANIYNKDDDYPDFIHKAGKSLSLMLEANKNKDNNPSGYAFVFGKSGTGEGIIMNKYKNVRCLTVYNNNKDIIFLGREHNNINSMSFGAGFVSIEYCIEAVNIFFNTNFLQGKHLTRVENIDIKIGL